MKQLITKPGAGQEESDEEMETNSSYTEINSDPEFEMVSLNNQIDHINSVLDELEKKNDSIKAKLVELLKSSQELRLAHGPPQEKPSAP